MITRRRRHIRIAVAFGALAFGIVAGCSSATTETPPQSVEVEEPTPTASEPAAAIEPAATEPAAPPVDAGPTAYQENGVWHVPLGGDAVEIPLGQTAVLEYEDNYATVEFTVLGAGPAGNSWVVETTHHIVAGDFWSFIAGGHLRVAPAGADLSCDTWDWASFAGPNDDGASSRSGGVGNTYNINVPYSLDEVGDGPHWVVFTDGKDDICPVAYWVVP